MRVCACVYHEEDLLEPLDAVFVPWRADVHTARLAANQMFRQQHDEALWRRTNTLKDARVFHVRKKKKKYIKYLKDDKKEVLLLALRRLHFLLQPLDLLLQLAFLILAGFVHVLVVPAVPLTTPAQKSF